MSYHDFFAHLQEQANLQQAACLALKAEISNDALQAGLTEGFDKEELATTTTLLHKVHENAVHYEMLMCILQARKVCSYYRDSVETFYKDNPQLNKTFLSCMVRIKSSTVSIIWVRQVYFSKEKSSKLTKSQVFSKYLRKGLKNRYSTVFAKNEIPFVRDLVEECENEFEVLRKQLSDLGRIRKLRGYKVDLTEN